MQVKSKQSLITEYRTLLINLCKHARIIHRNKFFRTVTMPETFQKWLSEQLLNQEEAKITEKII